MGFLDLVMIFHKFLKSDLGNNNNTMKRIYEYEDLQPVIDKLLQDKGVDA